MASPEESAGTPGIAALGAGSQYPVPRPASLYEFDSNPAGFEWVVVRIRNEASSAFSAAVEAQVTKFFLYVISLQSS